MRACAIVFVATAGAVTLLLATSIARADQAVTPGFTISAQDVDESLPAVAYNWIRDEYVVVWHTSPSGSARKIYASWLNRWGQVIRTSLIASGSNDRAQPTVAFDNVHDSYLVTYMRDGSGGGTSWDLAGVFLPGDIAGSQSIEFTICDWTSEQWSPQVVFNSYDAEYFVVWTNIPSGIPTYISGRRITTDGTGYPGAVTVASDYTYNRINPDVAYNLALDDYLVVYERVTAVNNSDIIGQRLTASAGPNGGEFAIADWPDTEEHPSVGCDHMSSRYLVAWHNSLPSIYARFVTGLGVVDGAPILVRATTSENREPDVACEPGNRQCLVVWQEQYTNSLFGISACRFSSDKSHEPFFDVRQAYTDSQSPAVTLGWGGFLAVWEQNRDGTVYEDIHGAIAWEVFADGFESNSTNRWSAIVP